MKFNSVLVTGANRGLGLEFVRQLATAPSPPKHIFATTRRPYEASKLRELAKEYSNIEIILFDVKEYGPRGSYRRLFDAIALNSDEGLNLIINNAAVSYQAPFETVAIEQLVDNFAINTIGPVLITKTLLPYLKRSSQENSTLIVNLTTRLCSIEECESVQNTNFTYKMSKTGLNMVTKLQSADLKQENIGVISLCPGWTRTNMGGKKAPLSPEESVTSMMKVIQGFVLEKDTGKFFYYDGTIIPW